MLTYTAKLGQFQIAGRPDLGTVEGVQLLQDGQPVAILWSLLDKRFYGAEKNKELRATLATVKRIIGRHDNYAAIVAAFCDHSREYHRMLALPMNDRPPTDVERVAAAFSEALAEELTGDEMQAVMDRNAQETDPAICHSHDYCDANICMEDAFTEAMGRAPNLQSDNDSAMWRDAWDIAKASDFNADSCRRYFGDASGRC